MLLLFCAILWVTVWLQEKKEKKTGSTVSLTSTDVLRECDVKTLVCVCVLQRVPYQKLWWVCGVGGWSHKNMSKHKHLTVPFRPYLGAYGQPTLQQGVVGAF